MLDHIGDSELYTGRELKRIVLEMVRGAGQAADRYVEVSEAAQILSLGRARPLTESAVRKRAQRWSEMNSPPVAVRKKGTGASSHWLLSEADLYSLSRGHNVRLDPKPQHPPERPADGSAAALEAYWCNIVTRNL